MNLMHTLWKRLTPTKALELSSEHEKAFFENVYRFSYIMGLSTCDRGGYLIYKYFVLVIIGLFVACEFWYLYSETSMDGIIENVAVTLIHIITIYRYKMMHNKAAFKELSTTMQSPYFDITTTKRKKILKLWILRNQRYFKLLLTLGSCTLAVWYIYPLVDDVEYNLPVALRLPIDFRSPARYWIVYPSILFVFHYISFFVIVNDMILQTYLMHMLCQYDTLADCFSNILIDCDGICTDIKMCNMAIRETFRKTYIARLDDLVRQHQFLLGNTIQLRNILSNPMLFQFAASSLLICLSGYQVTATVNVNVSKFLMNLLYLTYNMFDLYLFCRWCEEIKIQGENISKAVYSSGWECGIASTPGVRARLMIVIARANKPVVLSAGGIYDLSLESYTTLVKTSYSALTVLLRLRQ